MTDHLEPLAKPPAIPEKGDALLAKVSAVWIWSILFASNGALTYTYLVQNSPLSSLFLLNRMGGAGQRVGVEPITELALLAPSICFGVGMLASVLAWIFLYQFFTIYIVPVIFLINAPASEERRRLGGARFVRWAYRLLIVAGIARLLPELLTHLFPLFGRP